MTPEAAGEIEHGGVVKLAAIAEDDLQAGDVGSLACASSFTSLSRNRYGDRRRA
jgi:hypothetical protein